MPGTETEGADGAPATEATIATPAIDAAFAGSDTTPGEDVEGREWSKGAVILAGGAKPSSVKIAGRPVIVVEAWSDPRTDPDQPAERQADDYPVGDLYFRTDPDTSFGDRGPVYTLGVDVRQAGIWGFADRPGFVCVGPAMPAYAAANIAVQNGATDIEIYGLTDRQKGLLQPFLDDLKSDPDAPVTDGSGRGQSRPDVTITLK